MDWGFCSDDLVFLLGSFFLERYLLRVVLGEDDLPNRPRGVRPPVSHVPSRTRFLGQQMCSTRLAQPLQTHELSVRRASLCGLRLWSDVSWLLVERRLGPHVENTLLPLDGVARPACQF